MYKLQHERYACRTDSLQTKGIAHRPAYVGKKGSFHDGVGFLPPWTRAAAPGRAVSASESKMSQSGCPPSHQLPAHLKKRM